jgi:hypothetical protein
LYNDSTGMLHIAKSLMTLQTLYGIIPNIYAKGKNAKVFNCQFQSETQSNRKRNAFLLFD